MLLALAPLTPLIEGEPQVFGVSGYSGAGTSPSPRNDPAHLRDNLVPYQLVGHQHEREVSWLLGRRVRLLPHVAPCFRGLSLTISVALRRRATVTLLQQMLADAYAGEPLVEVTGQIPELRASAGRHVVTLGGLALDEEGRSAALVATLDNLLKGAATQALQNLNLALGLDELAGIPHTREEAA
jgi:N-acetyl-gamma-glutamylphosphate reductase